MSEGCAWKVGWPPSPHPGPPHRGEGEENALLPVTCGHKERSRLTRDLGDLGAFEGEVVLV